VVDVTTKLADLAIQWRPTWWAWEASWSSGDPWSYGWGHQSIGCCYSDSRHVPVSE